MNRTLENVRPEELGQSCSGDRGRGLPGKKPKPGKEREDGQKEKKLGRGQGTKLDFIPRGHHLLNPDVVYVS